MTSLPTVQELRARHPDWTPEDAADVLRSAERLRAMVREHKAEHPDYDSEAPSYDDDGDLARDLGEHQRCVGCGSPLSVCRCAWGNEEDGW